MAIQKKDRIKAWETLEKEVNASGLTCYLCCQGFQETKDDSFKDNGWGEEGEDGEPIGQYEDKDYETSWKEDVMFRLLDENLDYGKFNETEEEMDDPRPMHHSTMMDIRCTIAEEVASAWVFAGNDTKTNTVNSIETAQKLADELVAKVNYDDYVPITA